MNKKNNFFLLFFFFIFSDIYFLKVLSIDNQQQQQQSTFFSSTRSCPPCFELNTYTNKCEPVKVGTDPNDDCSESCGVKMVCSQNQHCVFPYYPICKCDWDKGTCIESEFDNYSDSSSTLNDDDEENDDKKRSGVIKSFNTPLIVDGKYFGDLTADLYANNDASFTMKLRETDQAMCYEPTTYMLQCGVIVIIVLLVILLRKLTKIERSMFYLEDFRPK